MTADVLNTDVGPVPVLHRLALGLLTRDALTGRGTHVALRISTEVPGRRPLADFEPAGLGRFRLRVGPPRPSVLTVLIGDPSRTFVPRRLRVMLWPRDRLVDDGPGAYVPVASRTIPVSLFPGAAYSLTRGTTAIRGRVARAGSPVPWARVAALDVNNTVLGRAHGDDRGEFLLVIADTFQNPVESEVAVRLMVSAPATAAAAPTIESAQLPGVPPTVPGPRNDAVLTGAILPTGYLPNNAPPATLNARVGAELIHPVEITFQP